MSSFSRVSCFLIEYLVNLCLQNYVSNIIVIIIVTNLIIKLVLVKSVDIQIIIIKTENSCGVQKLIHIK